MQRRKTDLEDPTKEFAGSAKRPTVVRVLLKAKQGFTENGRLYIASGDKMAAEIWLPRNLGGQRQRNLEM